MAHICAHCGKAHRKLSRCLMWRLPAPALDRQDELVFDDDYTCRLGDELHFISCELELPFKPNPDDLDPLGFICWVQVDRTTYDRYRRYRDDEEAFPPYTEWVRGALANPIPLVADSCGTAVGFEVLSGDPTPYVRWCVPGSTVAELLERGATVAYWHQAMGPG